MKKIILLFTYGVSIKEWRENGSLNRELDIYNELGKEYEISFFTYDKDIKRVGKIKVISRASVPKIIHSLFGPLIHYKRFREADIIKSNQIMGSWTAWTAKLFFRKKFVCRQGYQLSITEEKMGKKFIKKISQVIEKFSYKFSDIIICTTEKQKEYIKAYGVNNNKIMVIPNYINSDIFRGWEYKEKNRKKILYIGRLDPIKNLESLVKALEYSDYELTIIGKGPEKNKIEGILNQQKTKHTFIDRVDNEKLPKLMKNHGIFILPSFQEGNPKTLLEAMMCGMPVIGADSEGINNVITNKTGILSEKDSKSLRDKIDKLVSDKDLCINLGKEAREYIKEKQGLKQNLKKEIEVLENL